MKYEGFQTFEVRIFVLLMFINAISVSLKINTDTIPTVLFNVINVLFDTLYNIFQILSTCFVCGGATADFVHPWISIGRLKRQLLFDIL